MKRYTLALDLLDEPTLIAEYEHWHKQEIHWTDINQMIKDSGITDMQIYRIGNRLFMIMDTEDDFDGAKKAEQDAGNPRIQEWETLMNRFQQRLPWAKGDEKWVIMDKIFQLY